MYFWNRLLLLIVGGFSVAFAYTVPADAAGSSTKRKLCRSDHRCHDTWVIPAGQAQTVEPGHPDAFAGVWTSATRHAAYCFYVDGQGIPTERQPDVGDGTILIRTRHTMALLDAHGGARIELRLANFSQRPRRFTFIYFQYFDDSVGCPAGRRNSV